MAVLLIEISVQNRYLNRFLNLGQRFFIVCLIRVYCALDCERHFARRVVHCTRLKGRVAHDLPLYDLVQTKSIRLLNIFPNSIISNNF